ncbi:MAG: serine--tRNA ligase [Rhodospirillaceae bacterium]|jgi:seryl-tRNA synthetase|nr:serine--tRNA ligase [Rhodospirillaceae bacterium]
MHDLRLIRENPTDFDTGLTRRGIDPVSVEILNLDRDRRSAQTALQEMLQRRNEVSRQVGGAKKAGEDASALVIEVQSLKQKIADTENEQRNLASRLDALLEGLPNLPSPNTPDGEDETDNVEVRSFGEKPSFDFAPKEHFDLGEALDLMDFEFASRLSGSRFVVLKGALARMERALASFMLDLHTEEHGYTEVLPPVLVKEEALYNTGQLPKFSEDLFRTTDGYWLIPTAEVPLTNIPADSILDEGTLPMRVTAWTACFRSEAGAAGRDTRGMLRQHQFNKVEMVSVTHPDNSEAELERMTGCAEEVLKRLGIHYRVVALCAGDIGFGARQTYDIEAWIPGQDMYREISSCSNCGDFQARRMKARFRSAGEKGTRFVHTLNGSGLAVGRTLIAIMENYQNSDGSITIPEALRSYMGGKERIGPVAG